MNGPFFITLAGPLLAAVGWLMSTPALFWLGFAVCLVNLILNLASGVMKLPVLPVACMALAAGIQSPWWKGVATGLVAWTAIEAAGEVFARLRR